MRAARTCSATQGSPPNDLTFGSILGGRSGLQGSGDENASPECPRRCGGGVGVLIETVSIGNDERDKLLSRTEGHFFDFKGLGIAAAKLSRSISAFANADGGEILIGVDEAGGKFTWRGFNVPEDANGIFQMLEGTCPVGPGLDARFLRHESEIGLVLQLEIKKLKDIVSDRR